MQQGEETDRIFSNNFSQRHERSPFLEAWRLLKLLLIAVDIRPHHIVENKWFKNVVQVLEPGYRTARTPASVQRSHQNFMSRTRKKSRHPQLPSLQQGVPHKAMWQLTTSQWSGRWDVSCCLGSLFWGDLSSTLPQLLKEVEGCEGLKQHPSYHW